MCDVHDGDNYSLDLDYGYVAGYNEQYWGCKPGEEVSGKCLHIGAVYELTGSLAQYGIMNPFEFYDLHVQTLVHLMLEHEPSGKATSSMSTKNSITDPFEKLSNELIHQVVSYLKGGEVFLLRQASMIARSYKQ